MKKIIIFVCLILPFVAVKAQTFQRKTQQPAFFMPKSALQTNRQERLPAIENMNYQGQRPASFNYQNSKEEIIENKDVEAPKLLKQEELTTTTPPAPVITKTVEVKQPETHIAVKTETQVKENSKPNTTTTRNSENYQAEFTQILNRHKADLMRIRQGDYTQSSDISAMIESYKPKVYTIRDTVTPRSIVVK